MSLFTKQTTSPHNDKHDIINNPNIIITETNNKPAKFSFNNIIKSIPLKYVLLTPNDNLLSQNTHLEWRWRFYKIDNLQLIEISKLEYTKNRLYMNAAGDWIEYDIDKTFDQYIIKTFYYYSKL